MKIIYIIFLSFLFKTLTPSVASERYDGPKTLEEAKERFFQNRQLSKIEGIWYQQSENAYYAITKNDSSTFRKWTISHNRPEYNGFSKYKDSIRKTASPNLFIVKTLVYSTNNPNYTAETSATLILEGNLISYQIKNFTDKRGTKWGPFTQSNYIKVWPINTNYKNDKTITPNSNTKVFFNGEYYKKSTSSDYKSISGEKRDCTSFYSKKYYYYLCESSTRFSFSKEFLKNDLPYTTNDYLRYVYFKDAKGGEIAFKGFRKNQDNKIIMNGGWIGDKKIFYGVKNQKTKKWIALSDGRKTYISDTGLSKTEIKKLIKESKKHFNNAIQVKKDVEKLLGKQIVTSKFQTSKPKKNKKYVNSIHFKQYWWVVVLIAVVVFFVYMNTTKDLPKRKKTVKKISQRPGAIKKFFNGDIDLTTSFWGVYFFVGLIVGFVFFAIQKNNEALAGYYALIVLLPFRIFAIIGTWRSANKYKIEKQKKKQGTGWGTTAQVCIVLGIISSVLRMIRGF